MINVYTIFIVDTEWPTWQTSKPRKILRSIYSFMSNEYKFHIQFYLHVVVYKSVSNVQRSC